MGWAEFIAFLVGQDQQARQKSGAIGGLMLPRKAQNQDFNAQQVLNQFIADRGGNPYGN